MSDECGIMAVLVFLTFLYVAAYIYFDRGE